jgi:hypothetical protein
MKVLGITITLWTRESLCAIGWHSWTVWGFLGPVEKAARVEVFGEIQLKFAGLKLHIWERVCVHCGKEQIRTVRCSDGLEDIR